MGSKKIKAIAGEALSVGDMVCFGQDGRVYKMRKKRSIRKFIFICMIIILILSALAFWLIP